jgi:hypothetical protein
VSCFGQDESAVENDVTSIVTYLTTYCSKCFFSLHLCCFLHSTCAHASCFYFCVRRRHQFLQFPLLKPPKFPNSKCNLSNFIGYTFFPHRFCIFPVQMKTTVPLVLHHSPVCFINYNLVQGWVPHGDFIKCLPFHPMRGIVCL